MPDAPQPHVFALPPGVDFARELVAGLIERAQGRPPEDMARTRLFLNSGRSMRRVREEFDRLGPGFLPRMALISDLGAWAIPGLPPAAAPLRRRLEIARLVAGLTASLPQFEAGAGRFRLADSLARLLAEMQDEGVPPEALETLDIAETHAAHWQASLAFIRIVARFFDADAAPDPTGRERRAAETLAARWAEAPTDERIVIAGSTGSRGAAALFMRAVAKLPNGALVLPGFDFEMPDAAWRSLTAGPSPLEDHPQFRFRHLLDGLGLAQGAVERWTRTDPPAPLRNRLISLALRPAPVTDQWMREAAALPPLTPLAERMAVIEAEDERAEALALALALRRAVEEGRTAALITPNRMLTRRVTAALDRWGITPDDSAGQPLQLTAPGRFLRLVARLRGRRLMIADVLELLKHPLSATGSSIRGDHLRFTRDLELWLRARGPAFPDAAALTKWAADKDERAAWALWLGQLVADFATAPEAPLADCLDAHLTLAADLAAGPNGQVEASELWLREAGEQCRRILADLARQADAGGDYGAADYADLIDALLGAGQVRATQAAHPGVLILGALEARIQNADLVLLAGLNEGGWPEALDPDPWLSRQMRREAGLLSPERQIGLSAHDFQQAIAAPEVILSRAAREDGAETVPSRWLNRLTNLLAGAEGARGPDALARMRARGAEWLDLAHALGAPRLRLDPAPRPAPRPPVAHRPDELPVTAIKTLIRDPYAVYAGRVLRLRPLNPLAPEPDPRLRGQALHSIVERFVRERPEDEPPEAGARRLNQIAAEVLAEEIPWPSAQALWRARIARIAPQLARDEARRRAEGDRPALIEDRGRIAIGVGDFRLNARPDRIDVTPGGEARLYDYKSGKPPSDAEVEHFDKQLLLEAAMIERGAFETLGPRTVAAMTYVRLGGEGESRDLKMGAPEIAATWDKLRRLIARYADPATGYAARRAMRATGDASDYDHLARFGEWQITDAAQPEDMTPADDPGGDDAEGSAP